MQRDNDTDSVNSFVSGAPVLGADDYSPDEPEDPDPRFNFSMILAGALTMFLYARNEQKNCQNS